MFAKKRNSIGSNFFELYAFIILTSTLVLGINDFVIITRPLHPIPVRKRSSRGTGSDVLIYLLASRYAKKYLP